MKKQVTKFLSILLVVAIVSSCSSAFAVIETGGKGDSSDITVQWTNVNFLSAGLDISKMGKATCGFLIELINSTDTANVYYNLQQFKNGAWQKINSWSANGSGVFFDTRYEYLISGYNYRVVVTANIYNSSGHYIESATQTSDVQFY